MSQITSHILDTAKGKPAWGITVVLHQKVSGEWIEIGGGISNQDGRVSSILPEGEELSFGIYKMSFDTLHYFNTHDIETFYPRVEICFYIKTTEHYHIPLLISPYGYSTYRGS